MLNIYKPVGWTSFDIVRWIRRHVGDLKVGHAGTLDPFAEGVILVCIGAATKRVPELVALEKEYEGCIELGICTDTLDITGRIVQKRPIPILDEDSIQNASSEFIGNIEQLPPMYSAVKIDGRRLYQIARSGGKVQRKPKVVQIFSIKVLQYDVPFVFFRVRCSKGTYVRTLAADWAECMGTVGYLKTLKRIRVGHYKSNKAHFLNTIEKQHFPMFFSINNRVVNGNSLESEQ